MTIIRPNWKAPSNVHAISTTRLSLSDAVPGGEPTVYDYCNLGAHVGDKIAAVRANRENVVAKYNIPSKPVWLEQTHSIELVELVPIAAKDTTDELPTENLLLETERRVGSNGSDGSQYKADGSITREHEVVCTVMTADCLPLLLCDVQGTQVAAVHAGWRGMADGIIENAVSKFDCAAEHIIAWAGPCIGPRKFEVGLEVKQQLGGHSSHYQKYEIGSESNEGKVFADLYAICGFKLAEMGVRNYSHSSACTYSDQRQFYSYRRDGQCGRMASLIWIGEPA